MTHPGGGGSNEINLAALWIPVMPETSHMGEEMRKSGRESKRAWEEGFNSGASPESMGQSFGSKLQTSIAGEFKNFDLPFGASSFLDKFASDIDQKLVGKLRGEATQALQSYRSEFDNLTAAQQRNSEAESRLATAREGGFNKASIMLPLIQEQAAAHSNLAAATASAGAAHDNLTQKQSALSAEMSKTADGGKILAGIMGGLMVVGAQLAVGAVESLVEAIAEGFKGAIEITTELAKSAVELGETYEHIGIQIHEFSGATGEDFAKTEEAAQRVFSTLDVAGQDVGKTMAQLSSMLKVPGDDIVALTRDVTELQGRFTNLKATDLGAIFVAFKTPAEQADTALASLLQTARNAGQGLGDLTGMMSGNVALTLKEAGLNLEQAGKFTADLMQMQAPGRQVMTGMASAMKEFKAEGLDFSDGMRMASEKLKELGDSAAGQDLAFTLFGTRNWIVAKNAVQDYLDVLNAGPDAFNSNTAATQEFIGETETLDNKLETFKHKAEQAFKPFGDSAKNAVINGLNLVSIWFTTHHTEIINKIHEWGDKFIDMLPKIKEFTESAIRIIGDFATFLLYAFEPVATTMAAAGAGFLALTGHFKEAKDLLVMTANFDPSKISDAANMWADKIHNMSIDTAAMHDGWQGISDAANAMPQNPLGGSVFNQGSTFNPSGGFPGTPGAPGGAPGGGGGGGDAGPTAGPGGGTPATVGLGGTNVDARAGVKALARQMFPWSDSEWAAFDTLEMKEAGYDPTAKNASGAFGVGQFLGHEHDAYAAGYSDNPATQLRTMFQYISDRYGTPSAAWAQYYSGDHPQGAYAYGGAVDTQGAGGAGNPDWMPKGGWGPGGKESWDALLRGELPNPGWNDDHHADGHNTGWAVTGGKGGIDDIPAKLTAGEYVWDKGTVDKYGWVIAALHHGIGLDKGGPAEDPHTGGSGVLQVIYSNTATGQKTGEAGGAAVGPGTDQPGYYGADWEGHTGHVHTSFATGPDGSFYGLPKGTDIRQGQSGFPAWVYSVGQAFGIEASTYSGHQEGSGYNRGIDWWPKGHADMSGSSYTPEEKQRLQAFATSVATYGSARDGAGGSPSAWGMSAPLAFGTGPRGSDGAQFPGVDNQYGGLGVYGGETADQQASLAKAVREANDRKADLDRQVIVNQRTVDDLKTQIDKVGVSTKIGILTGQPEPLTPDEQAKVADKRKKLNDELDNATAALSKSQREQAEAGADISDAQRKQTEGTYKKPSGASKTTQKVTGESEFQALGAGFLSGIGQELGFGDLFGKPPWEWGAVKLLTGAASWALGTANAWADQIGQGKTGLTGNNGIPLPGWDGTSGGGGGSSILSGLAGGLGINLPKLATQGVSNAPNVIPNVTLPQALPPGQGGGPMSGPGVVNYDQSIHVASDVNPAAVLGPVQELQNSNNASLFTHDGGAPR